jgi:hypothetical protein
MVTLKITGGTNQRVSNLLVTCSRTWFQDDDGLVQFREALAVNALQRAALRLHPDGRPVPGAGSVMHHGNEPRGDQRLARIWESWGLPTLSHPADWSSCGPDCPPGQSCRRKRGQSAGWCVRAGHRRNGEMVALGHDSYVAFIRGCSKGATGCADLADRAGIPGERVLFPDH